MKVQVRRARNCWFDCANLTKDNISMKGFMLMLLVEPKMAFFTKITDYFEFHRERRMQEYLKPIPPVGGVIMLLPLQVDNKSSVPMELDNISSIQGNWTLDNLEDREPVIS